MMSETSTNEPDIPEINSTHQTKSSQSSAFSLSRTFGSDLVWWAAALGCILGVILFYFYTLQPIILNSYIDNASNQISSLKTELNEQLSSAASVAQTIGSQALYNSTRLCSQQELYTNLDADIQSINAGIASFIPDNSIRTVSTVFGFQDDRIAELYDGAYTEYEQILTDAKAELEGVKTIPAWLAYRSEWLQACQDIVNETPTRTLIRRTCSGIVSFDRDYRTLDKPLLWDAFKSRADSALELCNDDEIDGDPGQWKINWLARFARIMTYPVQVNSIIDTLKNNVDGFESTAVNTNTQMNEYFDSKRKINTVWYILDR